jgi:hypothetical protein
MDAGHDDIMHVVQWERVARTRGDLFKCDKRIGAGAFAVHTTRSPAIAKTSAIACLMGHSPYFVEPQHIEGYFEGKWAAESGSFLSGSSTKLAMNFSIRWVSSI